jgi:hypothetical protein
LALVTSKTTKVENPCPVCGAENKSCGGPPAHGYSVKQVGFMLEVGPVDKSNLPLARHDIFLDAEGNLTESRDEAVTLVARGGLPVEPWVAKQYGVELEHLMEPEMADEGEAEGPKSRPHPAFSGHQATVESHDKEPGDEALAEDQSVGGAVPESNTVPSNAVESKERGSVPASDLPRAAEDKEQDKDQGKAEDKALHGPQEAPKKK